MMTFEQLKAACADYFGFESKPTQPQETTQTKQPDTQETAPAWAQSLFAANQLLQERLSKLEATQTATPSEPQETKQPKETTEAEVTNQKEQTAQNVQPQQVQTEPQKPADAVPTWAQSFIDNMSKLQAQFGTLQQQVTQGQAVIGKPMANTGTPTKASDADAEEVFRLMGI